MKSSYELIIPYMEKAGITKQQLAKIAGVGPSAVTNWTRGSQIRIGKLSRIANHFGVDVRELIPCSDAPEMKQTEIQQETEIWKRRALDAESELRRYKSAFAKLAKSLRNASEVIEELEGGE